MSPRRSYLPLDLFVLIFQPVLLLITVAALSSVLLPIINAVRHPSASGWFAVFYVAVSAAFLGTVLLFFAKLPQYRTGSFWQLGFRHLPGPSQRLYHLAFLLIVTGTVLLVMLLVLAGRVR